MKKPNNLNEEIYRIKSLFTEERLYGNITDNQLINEITVPKGASEELIKKLFRKLKRTGNIRNVDINEKSVDDIINFLKRSNTDEGLKNIFNNLRKTQVDSLIKYFDDLNSGKMIKIFDDVPELGKPFYKLFPKEIRYDIALDYINRLPEKTAADLFPGVRVDYLNKKQGIERLFGINPKSPMGEIPSTDLSDIPSDLVDYFEDLKKEYITLTNNPEGYLDDIKIGKTSDEIMEEAMEKLSKNIEDIFNKMLKDSNGTLVLSKEFWDFLENNFKGITKFLEE